MGNDIKNYLTKSDFSRKEKILIVLASLDGEEKSPAQIRDEAIINGVPEAKKWNISQLLKDLSDKVIKLPNGWVISDEGKKHLGEKGFQFGSPVKEKKPKLREYSDYLESERVKEFVEEAISATEYKLLRSAVVISWVGAVSVLQEYVFYNCLQDFNLEAKNRYPKWKGVKKLDDLSLIKEYEFLQIIHKISLIGKNTKDELEQCLKLRNACGHPNGHQVGEHRVSSHLETLMLNVFSKDFL